MKTSFFLLALALTLSTSANAFTVPTTLSIASIGGGLRSSLTLLRASPNQSRDDSALDDNDNNKEQPRTSFASSAKTTAALTAAAAWTATTSVASAAGPDWGIFEGRTGSLLHPVTMGGLFLYTAYTAYLGFQWRRQRTLGDEIAALKREMPDLGGAASVAEAVAAQQQAGDDDTKMAALRAAGETEATIAALQRERKDLAAAGPRDKHFGQGTLLACVGTIFALEVRTNVRMHP